MINFNLGLQVTTAIYVGVKDVYVAQTKGSLLGVHLVKFGKVDIKTPDVSDQASQKQATIQAILSLLQENNITAKKVVVAIPGNEVLVRHFKMSLIPKSEWESAVKYEAKKYLPFKIEELMWDFHAVLPKKKGSKKMDVTFVAVKKEIGQKYLSLFKEAHLEVSALEPSSFSLMRFFTLSNQLHKGKCAAILEVDYGVANINIVKDKICHLTRDVSLPLEEELMFDSLLSEIRMSLDYYGKLFPAETVEKVLLADKLEVKNWDRKLAQELKVPVEKADTAKAIKIRKAIPSLDMAVAIGLALGQTILAGTEVNLCKFREIQPKGMVKHEIFEFTPRLKRALFLALTFSAIALFILHLGMVSPVRQEEEKLEKVISMRPQISLPIVSLSYKELEETKKELESKLSVLDLIINKKVFLTDKFNELPKVIPPRTWLTSLTFYDTLSKGNAVSRSLTLRGIAYHESTVVQIGIVTKFVSNLKENKVFSRGFNEIKLDSMSSGNLNQMSVKDFTITCFTQ